MKTLILFLVFIFTINVFSQNSWQSKSDLLGNFRSNASSFVVNGKAYIIGGGNGFGSAFNDVWEYDPVSDQWTQKSDFPGTGRAYSISFSIGSKGYFGIGAYFNGNSWVQLSDFWEYNSLTDTWLQKSSFPPGPRWMAASFEINGKGYIGTGSDSNGTYPDLWEYDPLTDLWIQKANFPFYRFGCVGFSLNGKGYFGLGTYCGVAYQEFYQYDPLSDSWIQKASISGIGRWHAVSLTLNSRAYVGTGVDILTNKLNDFYEYNDGNDTWTQKADFGGGLRYSAIGFSINNKGYIGTGYGNNFCKDLWEYSPDITLGYNLFNNRVEDINLYPIPTNSSLNITSIENIEMIKIINDIGVVLFQNIVNRNNFITDFSLFSDGVYYVHIITCKGETIKKVIKQ